MIASARIYGAVCGGTGFFQHGHTYLGHAAACAGALAVQQVIEEDDLLARVRTQGAGLLARLRQAFGGHDHVGDIRGRGMFLGLEFVADRATREPLDPSLRMHLRLKANAMGEGLICYPAGNTLDGGQGDHVLLAPPFILTEAQLDELVAKLQRAVARTFAEIGL
jgi:adenosylmethionine-8-amino-7-oxononanoate aminotransferase